MDARNLRTCGMTAPFGAGTLAGARGTLRRWALEASVHRSRFRQARRRPCVVMFPSSQAWSSSSNLRAWLVAPELERLGWRVIVVPEPLSLKQRQRILRLERPDVIWMHQTRHLLNQPHLYAPIPCVLDADDADYLDPRHHDRIVKCAEDAAAVVGGSRFVADLLGRHNEHRHVLWTCTPAPASPPPTAPEDRGPIVAWAHERPMLFPLEASLMQRVMTEVCRRTRCTFWLFGSEPSEAHAWLEPLRAAGGHCVAIPMLPYEAYLSKVAQSAVGLQPVCTQNEFSRGRSFGKILAYLGGQVAVVASDAVEHPKFFRQAENGFMATHAVEDWVEPIVRLCEDTALRRSVALAGWHDFQARLTTEVFARLLDPILQASIATAAAKPGPSF
jgi:hypothetical protein